MRDTVTTTTITITILIITFMGVSSPKTLKPYFLVLRMWLYLEIESLQMVREDEVIRVGPNPM